MKRLVLVAILALAGCREGGESQKAGAPKPPPSTTKPTTAVQSAPITEQALDTNGDGKVETWRRSEANGVVVESIDTDGDGKADQTRRLEPLDAPPPGFDELKLEQLPGGGETKTTKGEGE